MKYIVNKQLRQERMIGRRQQSYHICKDFLSHNS